MTAGLFHRSEQVAQSVSPCVHVTGEAHDTSPWSRGIRGRLTAAAAAVALALAALTTTTAAATPSGTSSGSSPAGAPPSGAHRPSDRTVGTADAQATAETRSLFSYLRDRRGEGILFGHQQTTEFGVTFEEADGVKSDVLAGVGDHPAVFGWDMSDEGFGSSPGTPEEKFATYAELIRDAHRIGGINTVSAHMNNFVTGGNYGDTDGDVVERILPGGDHNDEFNAYLDRVARLAHAITDDEGDPIPVIFRPFHENSGSWFWWGAAHASPSQYVELWRYTVEYLRDTKDVHNFLYAYAPGGGYGGTDEVYLRTYPGDTYVDVLGYDNYDGTDGSRQWLDGMVADLGMIARIAEERGKVSAFTEFGESGALRPAGQNGNLHWYTRVLDAVSADPDASRTAYMMTWTNFGTDQFFVPHPAHDGLAEHQLMPDFRGFEADPDSVFSSDLNLRDVFDRRVRAERHDAGARPDPVRLRPRDAGHGRSVRGGPRRRSLRRAVRRRQPVAPAALLRLRTPEPPAPPRKPGASLFPEPGAGVLALWRRPLLRPATAAAVIRNLGNTAASTASPLFACRTLGLTPGTVGVLFTPVGLDGAGGSWAADRLLVRFGLGRTPSAACPSGAVWTAAPPALWLPALPTLLMVGASASEGVPVWNATVTILRQSVTRPELPGGGPASRAGPVVQFLLRPITWAIATPTARMPAERASRTPVEPRRSEESDAFCRSASRRLTGETPLASIAAGSSTRATSSA
ncbi:hypothetical protein SUDANB176_00899 [Streptomyces sp. enrichment culture]